MQGYSNILITLQFQSFTQNSNGIEALFHHNFQEWTGSESVERAFPIPVWVPASEAGNTVLIMKANQGDLFNVDGSFVYEEDANNNYAPTLKIRANDIYPHSGHKFINKVTVIGGKALPKVSKAGKELFEVWASNPNKNGLSKYKCKVGVELPTPPNAQVNPATGYVDTKSQWLHLEANFDVNKGSGKSSSLFPWLAGQFVSFAGSLSVSGSKGKTYVTFFLSGKNDFLSATRAEERSEETKGKYTPVKVKGFQVADVAEGEDF